MVSLKRLVSTIFCLMIIGVSMSVSADDALSYDRVGLRTSVGTQVSNDTLIVAMYYQQQGTDSAALAADVNGVIAKAIEKIKSIGSVEVKTLSYQTQPMYKKQSLAGWRVRQSIQLKSKDVKGLSNLVGELQQELVLGSMSYSVSRGQRDEIEEKLIQEVIRHFKNRADLVAESLGGKAYRLVSLDIRTDNHAPSPVRIQAMSMPESARSAPAIEPGRQEMTTHAEGVIELVVN